ELLEREAAHVAALEPDDALGGLEEAVQVLRQGRLAGPVAANERHELARPDGEAHLGERLVSARVAMAEAAHVDQRQARPAGPREEARRPRHRPRRAQA